MNMDNSSVLDYKTEPLASIICTTYNHEPFIKDALQSFVSQNCPFHFEVIVGDDCSQDATAEIVHEYVNDYPGIFKGVFHKSNQYSQGKSVSEPLIKIAKGKYIAICEGDDYWIDNRKLAKQIGYMEAHPDCAFCFSNAHTLDIQNGLIGEKDMLPSTEDDARILNSVDNLTVREMLQLSFIPTASFVFRKENWLNRPIFPAGTFMGDRYLQLVMTSFGYAHYFEEPMCVYRVNNPNSMMGNWARCADKAISSYSGFINLYKEFDKYTQHEYSTIISKLITEREYGLYSLTGDYEHLREPRFKELSSKLRAKSRLAYHLRITFPKVMRILEGHI